MTKKAAISGRISHGSTGMVLTALMAKVTTMPASMPEATEAGILEISWVSGLNRPVAINRMPVTMKAPTASAMVKPLDAAISARPGVDQAVMTGIFVRQDSHRLSIAMARQSAVTQLAVSICVAPTALAAAMTMASVPPKPTMAATKADIGMEMRILAYPARWTMSPTALQQHVEILRPRQAVVAIGNERQRDVVGRQQADQLQRMA